MKGLISKLALMIALASPVAATEIPATKVDDGRPNLARTYEGDRSWYLSIPLIPNVQMNDLSMTWNGASLVNKALNLEVPDIEIDTEDGVGFNQEGVEQFMNDISEFPNIDGNLTTEAKIRFGILTEYVEVHVAGGVEGRADFRLRTIKGNYDLDEEKLELNEEKTVFEGFAYGDIVANGRLVVPVKIGNFVMKPFVEGGYRYREAFQGSVHLPQVVESNDDIVHTSEEEFRSSGQGYFFNAGILADFSKLEQYLRPVIAVTVDNVYSHMDYSVNGLALPENDPLMLNAGIQLSPFDILNLRADFLNILNNPEIRVEVERTFGPLELAVFGRLNERTLFGDRRNSVNAYVGLGGNVAKFGLFGSYDDTNNFGAGLTLNLGWHPEMQ
ncbi:hypothetical protein GOV03_00890 [Candidatus Woesearchaeota archaeon]|nr:hypothetical protein [Candidatus Woesearchaeota archaeon]